MEKVDREDTQPPIPKRVKVDEGDISADPHTDNTETEHTVIVLDDNNDEPEVRSKPESSERKGTENVSREASSSAQAGEYKEKESSLLFYLTKVRGIGAHYNRSDVAIGIKGKKSSSLYVH